MPVLTTRIETLDPTDFPGFVSILWDVLKSATPWPTAFASTTLCSGASFPAFGKKNHSNKEIAGCDDHIEETIVIPIILV